MKKITTAVITCAGFGTRFLPVTKTIQKEMLPILERPLVDYVVDDCIKAGIKRIIFIVSEHNQQLKHFYRKNDRLSEYLAKMEKSNLLEKINHLHTQAEYLFINQPDAAMYGTAIPVKLAEDYIDQDEAFLVYMGDDFVFNPDGASEASAMIELFHKSNSAGLVSCITKPQSELSRYGVAATKQENGFTFLTDLVEKPKSGTEPSNLVNISKYILTSEIFPIIKKQKVNENSGELFITDSVTTLAQQAPVVIHAPKGKYLDGGYPLGWLLANLEIAWNNPEMKESLMSWWEKKSSNS